MSAYILDDKNLDQILSIAARSETYRTIDASNVNDVYISFNLKSEQDLKELGTMLKQQNYDSVAYRYKEQKEVVSYSFKRQLNSIPAVYALKILDCYEYQACETPDYSRSLVAGLCAKLRRTLITMLPGYNDSNWGL